MTTIVVQTRLPKALADQIDQRAKVAGITRAEVARALLEAALASSQPVLAESQSDPLLDRLADEVGSLSARFDALLDASGRAERAAHTAHAASRLHALMALPQHQQQPFVDKLAKALRP